MLRKTNGLLLILRLIGNPTKNGMSWKRWGYTLFSIKEEYKGSISENGETSPEIRKIKDDISSFFSTLIFGTLLFILLQFSFDYLSSGSYSQFFARYTPSFPLYTPWVAQIFLFCHIVAYLAILVIVTAVGEYILEKCVPIDQEQN
ncbi:MAG: hypothetical protein ACYDEZ_03575 [Methanoregula sp.]|jgi:hypothetical protein